MQEDKQYWDTKIEYVQRATPNQLMERHELINARPDAFVIATQPIPCMEPQRTESGYVQAHAKENGVELYHYFVYYKQKQQQRNHQVNQPRQTGGLKL